MNNIQKAFKNKAKMGLRMANGGVLEDPFGFNNVLSNRNQRERQVSNPLEKIDGAIAMGNAVEGSNLTMSEKAALGMGTTSADASALRQKTSALGTLREGMLQQPGVGEQYGNWQRQNGLRTQNFADGGVVDPVEALLARTKANYGVSNASQPAAQAAPQPAQQPAPQPAPPAKDNSGGLFGKALRGLRGRAEAANFANGGIVKISGPGTGTSDDIPMKVNKGGQSLDVNVSNGEALAVLPAKTAQNPDAVEAVNEIIYQTNGKQPRGLRAGGHYADGTIDEQVARAGFRRLYGDRSAAMAVPTRPVAESAPAAPTATDTAPAAPATTTTARTLPFMSNVPDGTTEKIVAQRHRALYGDRPHAGNRQLGKAQPPVAQPAAQQGLKPAGTVVPMPQKPVSPDAAATAETREAAFAKAAGVDPEIAQLAAGTENRTAGFGTLRDATKFNVPKGSGGGVITGAADKNGLRRAMVVLPNGSPTQANPNAPRDIYGNDMSRTNDMKRQLAEIQRQNTDSDLASGLPFYQQRGLRALAADKMRAETDAARSKGGASALDVAKFNLDMAKFQHDLKRTDNMQGNADRKDDADRKSANVKRVTEMFDRFAPVSGLKGDDLKNAVSRRNEFEQAFYAANGGQMPTDPAKFDEQLPGMMRQARLTVALNDAVRNRGLWDKVKNLMDSNRDPRTGTAALAVDPRDDGKTVYYYGVPLSAEDIFGDDADLLQAYQERIAQTKARK